MYGFMKKKHLNAQKSNTFGMVYIVRLFIKTY